MTGPSPSEPAAIPPAWRQPPRRRRLWPRLLLALAGTAAIGLFAMAGNRPEAPVYETAPVARRTIEDTITATGRIRPRDFVDVGAQVSGQLARLAVAVGDRVAEGDLLAEIDAEVEAAEVEGLRADLARLEGERAEQRASLGFAEREHERNARLAARDALARTTADASLRDLEIGRARMDQIGARVRQAEADLRAREAALRRATIRAPIAGTVVAIEAREGQTLNANYDTPRLLTIADLGTMTVWTEVSEADVPKLRAGMPVWFTTLGEPDRRWPGTVRQILPVPPRPEQGEDGAQAPARSNVVVYTALFDVANPEGDLRGGMTAQVFFVRASAADALAIPVAALGADGSVRVLREDGTVETRAVEAGLRTRFNVEIRSGLAEGERVVTGEAPPGGPGNLRIEP